MEKLNEMVVKRLSVPLGLEELMESLSKEVLRKKPDDIYSFASEHFAQLLAIRDQGNYRSTLRKLSKSLSQASNGSLDRGYHRKAEALKIKSATTCTVARINKGVETPKAFLGKRNITSKVESNLSPRTAQKNNTNIHLIKTDKTKMILEKRRNKSISSGSTPRRASIKQPIELESKKIAEIRRPSIKKEHVQKQPRQKISDRKPDEKTLDRTRARTKEPGKTENSIELKTKKVLPKSKPKSEEAQKNGKDSVEGKTLVDGLLISKISTVVGDSTGRKNKDQESPTEGLQFKEKDIPEKVNEDMGKIVSKIPETIKENVDGMIGTSSQDTQSSKDDRTSEELKTAETSDGNAEELVNRELDKSSETLKEVIGKESNIDHVENDKTAMSLEKAATIIHDTKLSKDDSEELKFAETSEENAEEIVNSELDKSSETLKDVIGKESNIDPVENDKTAMSLEKAATIIQCLIRGFLARKKVLEKKKDMSEVGGDPIKKDYTTLQEFLDNEHIYYESERFDEHPARDNGQYLDIDQAKISSPFGSDVSPNHQVLETLSDKPNYLEEAATKIQSAWRGHKTRKCVRQIETHQQQQECDELPHQRLSCEDAQKAATVIQALFRGYLTRKRTPFAKYKPKFEETLPVVLEEADEESKSKEGSSPLHIGSTPSDVESQSSRAHQVDETDDIKELLQKLESVQIPQQDPNDDKNTLVRSETVEEIPCIKKAVSPLIGQDGDLEVVDNDDLSIDEASSGMTSLDDHLKEDIFDIKNDVQKLKATLEDGVQNIDSSIPITQPEDNNIGIKDLAKSMNEDVKKLEKTLTEDLHGDEKLIRSKTFDADKVDESLGKTLLECEELVRPVSKDSTTSTDSAKTVIFNDNVLENRFDDMDLSHEPFPKVDSSDGRLVSSTSPTYKEDNELQAVKDQSDDIVNDILDTATEKIHNFSKDITDQNAEKNSLERTATGIGDVGQVDDLPVMTDLKDKSATTIQKTYKGYRVRRDLKKQSEAKPEKLHDKEVEVDREITRYLKTITEPIRRAFSADKPYEDKHPAGLRERSQSAKPESPEYIYIPLRQYTEEEKEDSSNPLIPNKDALVGQEKEVPNDKNDQKHAGVKRPSEEVIAETAEDITTSAKPEKQTISSRGQDFKPSSQSIVPSQNVKPEYRYIPLRDYSEDLDTNHDKEIEGHIIPNLQTDMSSKTTVESGDNLSRSSAHGSKEISEYIDSIVKPIKLTFSPNKMAEKVPDTSVKPQTNEPEYQYIPLRGYSVEDASETSLAGDKKEVTEGSESKTGGSELEKNLTEARNQSANTLEVPIQNLSSPPDFFRDERSHKVRLKDLTKQGFEEEEVEPKDSLNASVESGDKAGKQVKFSDNVDANKQVQQDNINQNKADQSHPQIKDVERIVSNLENKGIDTEDNHKNDDTVLQDNIDSHGANLIKDSVPKHATKDLNEEEFHSAKAQLKYGNESESIISTQTDLGDESSYNNQKKPAQFYNETNDAKNVASKQDSVEKEVNDKTDKAVVQGKIDADSEEENVCRGRPTDSPKGNVIKSLAKVTSEQEDESERVLSTHEGLGVKNDDINQRKPDGSHDDIISTDVVSLKEENIESEDQGNDKTDVLIVRDAMGGKIKEENEGSDIKMESPEDNLKKGGVFNYKTQDKHKAEASMSTQENKPESPISMPINLSDEGEDNNQSKPNRPHHQINRTGVVQKQENVQTDDHENSKTHDAVIHGKTDTEIKEENNDESNEEFHDKNTIQTQKSDVDNIGGTHKDLDHKSNDCSQLEHDQSHIDINGTETIVSKQENSQREGQQHSKTDVVQDKIDTDNKEEKHDSDEKDNFPTGILNKDGVSDHEIINKNREDAYSIKNMPTKENEPSNVISSRTSLGDINQTKMDQSLDELHGTESVASTQGNADKEGQANSEIDDAVGQDEIDTKIKTGSERSDREIDLSKEKVNEDIASNQGTRDITKTEFASAKVMPKQGNASENAISTHEDLGAERDDKNQLKADGSLDEVHCNEIVALKQENTDEEGQGNDKIDDAVGQVCASSCSSTEVSSTQENESESVVSTHTDVGDASNDTNQPKQYLSGDEKTVTEGVASTQENTKTEGQDDEKIDEAVLQDKIDTETNKENVGTDSRIGSAKPNLNNDGVYINETKDKSKVESNSTKGVTTQENESERVVATNTESGDVSLGNNRPKRDVSHDEKTVRESVQENTKTEGQEYDQTDEVVDKIGTETKKGNGSSASRTDSAKLNLNKDSVHTQEIEEKNKVESHSTRGMSIEENDSKGKKADIEKPKADLSHDEKAITEIVASKEENTKRKGQEDDKIDEPIVQDIIGTETEKENRSDKEIDSGKVNLNQENVAHHESEDMKKEENHSIKVMAMQENNFESIISKHHNVGDDSDDDNQQKPDRLHDELNGTENTASKQETAEGESKGHDKTDAVIVQDKVDTEIKEDNDGSDRISNSLKRNLSKDGVLNHSLEVLTTQKNESESVVSTHTDVGDVNNDNNQSKQDLSDDEKTVTESVASTQETAKTEGQDDEKIDKAVLQDKIDTKTNKDTGGSNTRIGSAKLNLNKDGVYANETKDKSKVEPQSTKGMTTQENESESVGSTNTDSGDVSIDQNRLKRDLLHDEKTVTESVASAQENTDAKGLADDKTDQAVVKIDTETKKGNGSTTDTDSGDVSVDNNRPKRALSHDENTITENVASKQENIKTEGQEVDKTNESVIKIDTETKKGNGSSANSTNSAKLNLTNDSVHTQETEEKNKVESHSTRGMSIEENDSKSEKAYIEKLKADLSHDEKAITEIVASKQENTNKEGREGDKTDERIIQDIIATETDKDNSGSDNDIDSGKVNLNTENVSNHESGDIKKEENHSTNVMAMEENESDGMISKNDNVGGESDDDNQLKPDRLHEELNGTENIASKQQTAEGESKGHDKTDAVIVQDKVDTEIKEDNDGSDRISNSLKRNLSKDGVLNHSSEVLTTQKNESESVVSTHIDVGDVNNGNNQPKQDLSDDETTVTESVASTEENTITDGQDDKKIDEAVVQDKIDTETNKDTGGSNTRIGSAKLNLNKDGVYTNDTKDKSKDESHSTKGVTTQGNESESVVSTNTGDVSMDNNRPKRDLSHVEKPVNESVALKQENTETEGQEVDKTDEAVLKIDTETKKGNGSSANSTDSAKLNLNNDSVHTQETVEKNKVKSHSTRGTSIEESDSKGKKVDIEKPKADLYHDEKAITEIEASKEEHFKRKDQEDDKTDEHIVQDIIGTETEKENRSDKEIDSSKGNLNQENVAHHESQDMMREENHSRNVMATQENESESIISKHHNVGDDSDDNYQQKPDRLHDELNGTENTASKQETAEGESKGHDKTDDVITQDKVHIENKEDNDGSNRINNSLKRNVSKDGVLNHSTEVLTTQKNESESAVSTHTDVGDVNNDNNQSKQDLSDDEKTVTESVASTQENTVTEGQDDKRTDEAVVQDKIDSKTNKDTGGSNTRIGSAKLNLNKDAVYTHKTKDKSIVESHSTKGVTTQENESESPVSTNTDSGDVSIDQNRLKRDLFHGEKTVTESVASAQENTDAKGLADDKTDQTVVKIDTETKKGNGSTTNTDSGDVSVDNNRPKRALSHDENTVTENVASKQENTETEGQEVDKTNESVIKIDTETKKGNGSSASRTNSAKLNLTNDSVHTQETEEKNKVESHSTRGMSIEENDSKNGKAYIEKLKTDLSHDERAITEIVASKQENTNREGQEGDKTDEPIVQDIIATETDKDNSGSDNDTDSGKVNLNTENVSNHESGDIKKEENHSTNVMVMEENESDGMISKNDNVCGESEEDNQQKPDRLHVELNGTENTASKQETAEGESKGHDKTDAVIVQDKVDTEIKEDNDGSDRVSNSLKRNLSKDGVLNHSTEVLTTQKNESESVVSTHTDVGDVNNDNNQSKQDFSDDEKTVTGSVASTQENTVTDGKDDKKTDDAVVQDKIDTETNKDTGGSNTRIGSAKVNLNKVGVYNHETKDKSKVESHSIKGMTNQENQSESMGSTNTDSGDVSIAQNRLKRDLLHGEKTVTEGVASAQENTDAKGLADNKTDQAVVKIDTETKKGNGSTTNTDSGDVSVDNNRPKRAVSHDENTVTENLASKQENTETEGQEVDKTNESVIKIDIETKKGNGSSASRTNSAKLNVNKDSVQTEETKETNKVESHSTRGMSIEENDSKSEKAYIEKLKTDLSHDERAITEIEASKQEHSKRKGQEDDKTDEHIVQDIIGTETEKENRSDKKIDSGKVNLNQENVAHHESEDTKKEENHSTKVMPIEENESESIISKHHNVGDENDNKNQQKPDRPHDELNGTDSLSSKENDQTEGQENGKTDVADVKIDTESQPKIDLNKQETSDRNTDSAKVIPSLESGSESVISTRKDFIDEGDDIIPTESRRPEFENNSDDPGKDKIKFTEHIEEESLEQNNKFEKASSVNYSPAVPQHNVQKPDTKFSLDNTTHSLVNKPNQSHTRQSNKDEETDEEQNDVFNTTPSKDITEDGDINQHVAKLEKKLVDDDKALARNNREEENSSEYIDNKVAEDAIKVTNNMVAPTGTDTQNVNDKVNAALDVLNLSKEDDRLKDISEEKGLSNLVTKPSDNGESNKKNSQQNSDEIDTDINILKNKEHGGIVDNMFPKVEDKKSDKIKSLESNRNNNYDNGVLDNTNNISAPQKQEVEKPNATNIGTSGLTVEDDRVVANEGKKIKNLTRTQSYDFTDNRNISNKLSSNQNPLTPSGNKDVLDRRNINKSTGYLNGVADNNGTLTSGNKLNVKNYNNQNGSRIGEPNIMYPLVTDLSKMQQHQTDTLYKDLNENVDEKHISNNNQNKSEPFYLHQENLPYKVPATSQEKAFSEILKLSFDNEKAAEEHAKTKKKEVYDSIPVKGNLGSSRSSMDDPKQVPQHVSEGIQCNLPNESGQQGSTVLVQTTDDQDNIVPVAVQMSQVPAGAALVTSDSGSRSNSRNAVYSATSVGDTTQAHDVHSQESKNAPLQPDISNGKLLCAEADVGMETEKRNNSTIVKKTMEQEAATKIQASFRGYQVRKQLKNKLAGDNITSIKRTSRRKSLGRIMDSNKNTSNKNPSPLEEVSATKIQAGVRGFLVRRRQQKTKSTPESP